MYFKNWINAGIVYVKDLFNYEGRFLFENDLLSGKILGLDEDGVQNINTARNNVISVIACGTYCTWVKCEDSKQPIISRLRLKAVVGRL